MQPESRADGHDTLIDDNRAYGRDTFIYDSNHRDTLLGGLWIAEGTTNANLYYMVEIICVFTGTFDLHDDNEQLVKRDEKPLQPGNYFIVSNGKSLLRFLRWPLKSAVRQCCRQDNVASAAN